MYSRIDRSHCSFIRSFSQLTFVKLYTLRFPQNKTNYDRKWPFWRPLEGICTLHRHIIFRYVCNYSAKLLNLNEWYYSTLKAITSCILYYMMPVLVLVLTLCVMSYDASRRPTSTIAMEKIHRKACQFVFETNLGRVCLQSPFWCFIYSIPLSTFTRLRRQTWHWIIFFFRSFSIR